MLIKSLHKSFLQFFCFSRLFPPCCNAEHKFGSYMAPWNLFFRVVNLHYTYKLICSRNFAPWAIAWDAFPSIKSAPIYTILETTLDCFASPWNSTKLHHLTKCCFSSPRISPYIWDHNSKTKAQIKKLKTCDSQQWPTLSNGMSYSCMWNFSFEKSGVQWRGSLSLFYFI